MLEILKGTRKGFLELATGDLLVPFFVVVVLARRASWCFFCLSDFDDFFVVDLVYMRAQFILLRKYIHFYLVCSLISTLSILVVATLAVVKCCLAKPRVLGIHYESIATTPLFTDVVRSTTRLSVPSSQG